MSRLIDQLLAQRKSWVDIAPGKRVQIIRPPESDIGDFLKEDGSHRSMLVRLDHVQKYTTGWEGFTEADLLGSAVGASDPVPFDPELWAIVVADNNDWIKRVSAALLKTIVDHFSNRVAAEKNSPPYSTGAMELGTKAS